MPRLLEGENSVNFWEKPKQANEQKVSLVGDDHTS